MNTVDYQKTLEGLRSNINQQLDQLSASYEEVRKKATGELPKIEKIEPANPFGSYASDWVNNLVRKLTTSPSYSHCDIPPTPECLEQEGKKILDEMKAKGDAAHVNNIPKMESNKILAEKLTFLMGQIGMPGTYRKKSEYKTRRRRYSWDDGYEMITVNAGWTTDLSREVIVNDGYDAMLAEYKNHVSALGMKVAEMRQKIHNEAAKKAAEEAGNAAQQAAIQAREAEIARLREQLKQQSQILGE